MAYQIGISVRGADGDDTSLGEIELHVPVQLFYKMDGEPPTYQTIKHTEEVIGQALAEIKNSLVDLLVMKLNEESGKKK